MKKALQSVLAVSAIAAAGLHQALAEKYEQSREDGRAVYSYHCSGNHSFVLSYDPISRSHSVSGWFGRTFHPDQVIIVPDKGRRLTEHPKLIQANNDNGSLGFILTQAGDSHILTLEEQGVLATASVSCQIQSLR